MLKAATVPTFVVPPPTGKTKGRASSRRVVSKQTSNCQDSTITDTTKRGHKISDPGCSIREGVEFEAVTGSCLRAGALKFSDHVLELSISTQDTIKNAKTGKLRQKAKYKKQVNQSKESGFSQWMDGLKIHEEAETAETDDPGTQGATLTPVKPGLASTAPSDRAVRFCLESAEPELAHIEPDLSRSTMSLLSRLGRSSAGPAAEGFDLPFEFKKLLHVFGQIERALPVLLTHKGTAHLPVEALAGVLALDTDDLILLLRKILGVWPEAVWVCWIESDGQPKGTAPVASSSRQDSNWVLHIGRGGSGDPDKLSSQRIGVSSHSLSLIEFRKAQFETRLNELVQNKRGIPISKLPSLPTRSQQQRQDGSAVKTFLAFDDSVKKQRLERLDRRIQELMESGAKNSAPSRENNIFSKSDLVSASGVCLQASADLSSATSRQLPGLFDKDNIASQSTAFVESITEMIREKEQKIKEARDIFSKNLSNSRYSVEELSQAAALIKCFFTERQVNNVFLAQLIDKMAKSGLKSAKQVKIDY